jgi:hypothetical protein
LLHGSGDITTAFHCFQIVFINDVALRAMHFCLVAREPGGRLALPHSKLPSGVPSFWQNYFDFHE